MDSLSGGPCEKAAATKVRESASVVTRRIGPHPAAYRPVILAAERAFYFYQRHRAAPFASFWPTPKARAISTLTVRPPHLVRTSAPHRAWRHPALAYPRLWRRGRHFAMRGRRGASRRQAQSRQAHPPVSRTCRGRLALDLIAAIRPLNPRAGALPDEYSTSRRWHWRRRRRWTWCGASCASAGEEVARCVLARDRHELANFEHPSAGRAAGMEPAPRDQCCWSPATGWRVSRP